MTNAQKLSQKTPSPVPGKKQQVERMFDGIAPTYDALNHILSLGIDRFWRRAVVKIAAETASPAAAINYEKKYSFHVLDIATGTGDLAIALARKIPSAHITGVDISEKMLAIGRQKIMNYEFNRSSRTSASDEKTAKSCRVAEATLAPPKGGEAAQNDDHTKRRNAADGTQGNARRKRGLFSAAAGDCGGLSASHDIPCRITLQPGDAEQLSEFADGSFDMVTAAFGVRNFGDIAAGLREMQRVTKPGGRCLILEFSEPRGSVFGPVYRLYFHRILPLVGRLISRDGGAYSYLPQSVDTFPAPEKFAEMLLDAGFSAVETKRLTFGVAYIYICEK